jgi:hypothetical protein
MSTDDDAAGGEVHLGLLIQYKDGRPLREPVHAVALGDGRFRVLYSPGFVQGVAAGDEVRVLDADGGFEVVRRGGHLAVQVFSATPVGPYKAKLTSLAERIGGRLDGAIGNGMAFTFPMSTGFAAIEALFDDWVRERAGGWEWYFGNVYDPMDGVTPLNWWVG